MQLIDYLIQITETNIEILSSSVSCFQSCLDYYDKQLQGFENLKSQLLDEKEENNVNR